MSDEQDSQFFRLPIDEHLSVPVREETIWIEGVHPTAGDKSIGTRKFVTESITTKRLYIFIILVAVTFLLLVMRVGFLQIVQGASYRDAAEGNRQRALPIPAERGLIFDKNNIQMTKNVPNFALALVPQDLPRDKEERKNIIGRVASLTHTPVEEIAETIEKYGSYSYESIIIQEDLDYDTAMNVYIASADIPGIHIQRGSKRLYVEEKDESEMPLPISLSHVLGYLGKLSPEELDSLYQVGYLPSDTIGKTGVEKTYEPFLRGTYGTKQIEVDSFGKEQKVLSEDPPAPGSHVVLSVDIHMQKALEYYIQKALDVGGFSRASAIAMDPRDGSIRALVSLPSFDSNDFSGGIDIDTYQTYIDDANQPLFNRAISGAFPSGSSIKPAFAAAALQEGLVTQNTTFLSTGGLAVGQWFFPDWQSGGHGITNIRRSIAWSVNTFYYYIGGGFGDFVGMGVEKMMEYLKYFGFDATLGIDLPGEVAGFLPSKEWKEQTKGERWYVGDTYNISIGQGDILVTPLQITSYIATIANGGTIFKPHVVEKTIDIATGVEHAISSEVLKIVPISDTNLNIVRLGMKDCVDYGACRRLSSLPFEIAGKTGTAQWSSVKEPHAWFTSFAPYENPEIVLTILIEEGIGGSESATPVAYDFYRWWWTYKTTGDISLDE
ncbi:MAG: Peptidoglycan glycosyltransferase [Candidatus Magasanikbacteria bacterium GW2011_GWD2_43_18]|uniref:Peptidoglycan glycosyltransferase n=1 Tax=Candidatus Magasanikbacteria bacterium GW2011_GWE2_42_7 TaxID=1619052 RepID=A0A0G1BHZ6_9BACT|nr:MAG: Peptidoglycan glycosyltransferase [Candidatus Magasanikbacteria bacterium GW2011_GWC2_42_27]KKS73025.1 MAG: Peptidoglycan glycosyltransferase [Candidatus Magasanikbacteria bacterium GW2011_GWE2_42_7]KKT03989.1 MAG: Peptidoglycan glycosyltransferase [Candidatus Magasanikbacteria bacterium GW2011_GWD2_43_18]KKT26007.1 MAG: Peptidoglycan glycosyltransferase [Candidatus Magasanikbacteria bacterium GW2011_GWA2_43_9]HBB37709.1 penicillin-binding protein 2 [Candidatus Magasanikbacteria bacteri